MVSVQDQRTPTVELSQELRATGHEKWADAMDHCGTEVKRVVCEKCSWQHTIKERCKLRSCPTCSSWKAFRVQRRYLKAINTFQEPKLLTLTLRSSPDLAATMWRLRKCLEKFRRRAPVKRFLFGGLYAIEANPHEGGLWNVHAHLLVDAAFRPQAWISKLWKEITGDSWIVDIRWVRDPQRALKYLLEYMTKGPASTHGLWNSSEIVTFMEELEDMRLVQPFGKLLGAAERPPAFVCPECGCNIFRVEDVLTGMVMFSELSRLYHLSMKLGP